MSVQAGIWNFDGEPIDRSILARISGQTAEYGPDGESTHKDGNIGMLYRPFHTTPESRQEQQPYLFDNGKVITWDGRLDNREELTSQLATPLQRNTTDVAIVAKAYETWNERCFSKLRGDWALSIWDPKENVLLLSRDYIGIRHLFYYHNERRVVWCTLLESLISCEKQWALSEEYIAGFLSFWPDAKLTPYREIRSVPPAGFVCIRPGNITKRFYWIFNPSRRTRCKTDGEYEEQYRYLFRQSVDRRLRHDSPILAELSGGLDSSSIVFMADDILQENGVETSSIRTFSAYDPDEPGDEDFAYFSEVEKARGARGHHAQIQCTGETLCLEPQKAAVTPGFGATREFLIAQSALIRREGFRVVLSGLGGDEFNGQALDFRVPTADLLVQLQLSKLAKDLVTWSLRTRRPWIHLFAQTFALVLPRGLRIYLSDLPTRRSIIEKNFARRHRAFSYLLTASEGSLWWLPSIRDAFQTYSTLAREMAQKRPSSLGEVRYPFLDQDLVEFLGSIPTSQLLQPGHRRFLMRRALADLLPKSILMRDTKASGGRSIALTLEKQWTKVEELVEEPAIGALGFVNSTAFRTALRDIKNGKMLPQYRECLRALAVEVWLRGVFEQGVVVRPSTSSHPPTRA